MRRKPCANLPVCPPAEPRGPAHDQPFKQPCRFYTSWAAAPGKSLPITADVRLLNGEAAAVVVVPAAGDAIMASIHIETRDGRIAALRVIRDPGKLGWRIGGKDGVPCPS